jgi:hypothetical protein
LKPLRTSIVLPLTLMTLLAPIQVALAQAPRPPKFRLADPITLSATNLSATQRQQTFTAKTRMLYLPDAFAKGWSYKRTLLDFSSTYDAKKSDTSPLNITRRHLLLLQHLHSVTKNNKGFVMANAELYHNNALGMRLQQSYGGGGGYTFQRSAPRNGVNTVLSDLELSSEFRVLDQNFTKQARQRFAAALIRQQFTQDLGSFCNASTPAATPCPRVQFISIFSTIMPFAESDAWQMRGYAALVLPFNSRFAMRLSSFGDYLRNAPKPFRKSFVVSTIGVDIKFP